ncbi:MAG TPA: hypothetical protein VNU70_01780 [Puia sp.]|jgi:hypothetical protein|nr:hypothetical protein [Puia sp.]
MKIAYTLLVRTFWPAILLIVVFALPQCSKNTGPNNHQNDSDTIFRRKVTAFDSSAFHVVFDMLLTRTSGVFQDSCEDFASIQIVIRNGVISFPADSIQNIAPLVQPTSGKEGDWSAVWVPDDIGEINITGASAILLPGDSIVVVTLKESGTVSPKWMISFLNGTPTSAGGDQTPGWPLAFDFNINLKNQDAFKLDQPGSFWLVWVIKDY